MFKPILSQASWNLLAQQRPPSLGWLCSVARSIWHWPATGPYQIVDDLVISDTIYNVYTMWQPCVTVQCWVSAGIVGMKFYHLSRSIEHHQWKRKRRQKLHLQSFKDSRVPRTAVGRRRQDLRHSSLGQPMATASIRHAALAVPGEVPTVPRKPGVGVISGRHRQCWPVGLTLEWFP
jgi:hypothetical protein